MITTVGLSGLLLLLAFPSGGMSWLVGATLGAGVFAAHPVFGGALLQFLDVGTP
jgi:hypothetical protein